MSKFRSSDSPSTVSRRKSSVASDSPLRMHPVREDNMSEAPFPLRKGSQDVYRARDITQRAPSIAPSTMIPSTIPYPGVYTSSQTLSTSGAVSVASQSSSQLSGKQQASFGQAALNAAGLPSRMNFLGLGRKSSKRMASNHRSKMSDVYGNFSMSTPLQAPPGTQPGPVSRPNALRPSGPRPSFSSSGSDREYAGSPLTTIHSHTSGSSLPSVSYPSNPAFSLPSRPSMSSLRSATLTSSTHDSVAKGEALTAMTDILPDAQEEVLLRYLYAAGGDHLVAIGRYLDDSKQQKV